MTLSPLDSGFGMIEICAYTYTCTISSSMAVSSKSQMFSPVSCQQHVALPCHYETNYAYGWWCWWYHYGERSNKHTGFDWRSCRKCIARKKKRTSAQKNQLWWCPKLGLKEPSLGALFRSSLSSISRWYCWFLSEIESRYKGCLFYNIRNPWDPWEQNLDTQITRSTVT